MGNALLLITCCVKKNDVGDDGVDEETWRAWSDLPDLVLHTILMHLMRGKETYIAFSGVCRNWRSVGRAPAMELMASMPMIIRRPTSIGSKFSLFSLCENRIYGNLIVPANIHGQMEWGFFGGPVYSRGHLIMRSVRGNLIPLVVNPWNGARWEFPFTPIFWCKAILSETPTSPDCVLVLFSFRSIQWCRIGGSEWSSWTHPNPHPGTWVGKSALALGNKLFWSDCIGRLLEMDMSDRSYTTPSKPSPLLWDAPHFGPPFHYWEPGLVDVGGELLMINANNNLHSCIAWRLDCSSQMKRWVKVESLGFHAVVVVSHYVSEAEAYDTRIVKGLVNNCVYYYDPKDDDGKTRLLKVWWGTNIDGANLD